MAKLSKDSKVLKLKSQIGFFAVEATAYDDQLESHKVKLDHMEGNMMLNQEENSYYRHQAKQ